MADPYSHKNILFTELPIMSENPAFTPSFTRKDVTLHKKETLFKNYFQVDRYTFSHKAFDGRDVGPFTREIFERGHAALCLPYDPTRNEVILIEQFRPGPFAANDENCWCIEAVAGIIDEDETGEEVAIRESMEEAGCQIKKLFKTGLYYPTGGGSSETIECFVGICSTDKTGGIHGVPDEGENIRAFAIDFDQALNAALVGKFSNLPLVATLQWLALKKPGLGL